ncbi:hypothetical protein OSB04_017784 [Centaurea solstitialis]|uniref:Uncharacterized protein n=1 Tax=Centaurea solstitialis TaxID=347529 RepID=A0AA38T3J3_9ASTR|nr:hypothetical protein OSB04_017784 [Centaurea solstitialis]
MADKQVSTLSTNPEDESTRPPNPFVSIISKFTEVFNSRFPPPASEKKDVVVKVEKERKVAGGEVVVVEESKPVTVRFPEAPTTTVAPPLKEEVVERDRKPVVLWQVYAIGGFFILKWALGRWKEHRANKKPSDQDSPPPSAAAANE